MGAQAVAVMLPAAPLDIKMEPWWGVQVVNVGE
jgi:hypothetical protein